MKKKKMNYIFVDFENVQPSFDNLPSNLPIKIFLFIGAKQKRIPVELAVSIQKLGIETEYICIDKIGKNALDFHIVFYLGKIYEQDHDGYFHIISKDTGFDILIEHLREKQISVRRFDDIEDIPISNRHSLSLIDEQIDSFIEHFKKDNRPKRLESLYNVIYSLSGKTLNDNQLNKIVNRMRQRKIIKIDNSNQVIYNMLSETDERVNRVVEYLQRGRKPKTLYSLHNAIYSFLGQSLNDKQIDRIINKMLEQELIEEDEYNELIYYI